MTNSRHPLKTKSRRQATVLLLVLISLPLALGTILIVLNQIDVLRNRTQRDEIAAQARLLAESALARWDRKPPNGPGLMLEGKIEGAGSYQLIAEASSAGPLKIVGIGICERSLMKIERRIQLDSSNGQPIAALLSGSIVPVVTPQPTPMEQTFSPPSEAKRNGAPPPFFRSSGATSSSPFAPPPSVITEPKAAPQ